MKKNYEKTGLTISIIGGLILASSGILVSILAKSQAILLDGMFTFITLIMSLISLKVTNMINKPETKKNPYGFVALEPFLNLTKSIVLLVLLLTCLGTNIQSILSGGRETELGIATSYTLSCIVIYLIIIFLLRKCVKRTDSSILLLEVKEWYIDTMLTVGIAVSLGVVFILYNMGYTSILPYIDPSLVIVLALVSLIMPIKVLIIEMKRLLLISTENLIEKDVENHIKDIVDKHGLKTPNVYAVKIGRIYQIFIYTDLEDPNTCIKTMDTIRIEIREELSKHYVKNYTDIIFSQIDCEATS